MTALEGRQNMVRVAFQVNQNDRQLRAGLTGELMQMPQVDL